MIVSFLFHPVAFLLGVLAMMGYGWATGWPEDEWYSLGIFVVVYLVGYIWLPERTRPGYYINARKRHELLWGKESAAKKFGTPAEQTKWAVEPQWMREEDGNIRWPQD